MSDPLAILAVTRTLQSLLLNAAQTALPGAEVTTRPLDKARDSSRGPQLNLFLYHMAEDAAWRNMDMPSSPNGEVGYPPLALTLDYLVTAYGTDDDDADAHRILGTAMSALHDHPLLGARELRLRLPDSDLYRQVERVRIVNLTLSMDEMSKLWMTFQTQYRISTAYQVSVVLIESRRPTLAAPPVATRGEGDTGVVVRPNLLTPFPTIEAVVPSEIESGGTFELTGHDLSGDSLELRFTHPALLAPVTTAPAPSPSDVSFTSVLPAGVPAGASTVAALVTKGAGPATPSKEIPLMVRPTVTNAPLTASRDASGGVTVTVAVSPPVLDGQDAFLLAGSQKVRAEPFPTPASELTFKFAAQPGVFPMRLRIDGADSRLIADTVPQSYDPGQQLVVT